MRRSLVATALCLVCVGATLGTAGPVLAEDPAGTPAPAAAGPAGQPSPSEVLDSAIAVLEGDTPEVGPGAPPAAGPEAAPEPTLALRDLRAVLPRLTGADRKRAEAALARPTDGYRDPYGDGYRTRATRRTCNPDLCVHWVTRTADAPPSRAWVDTTKQVLADAWATEVDGLGFRPPLPDGDRGGNGKLDVYLKDLGDQGYYGYCSTERVLRTNDRRASGYCVLDDDFSRLQYGTRPDRALKATASHELLHASQFGYDWLEDAWFMEATATWAEERAFDGVNDNRQFLPYGQFGIPGQSLDTYSSLYGNWVFFEHLTEDVDVAGQPSVVRRAWENAGQARDDGKTYSMKAVSRALSDAGQTLSSVFADYATALVTPAEEFEEGDAWDDPTFTTDRTLGAGESSEPLVRLDHLATKASRWTPAASLTTPGTTLQVRVDGPPSKASPVARVVHRHPDGTLSPYDVPLGGDGVGNVAVPFSTAVTEAVYVVLGNASARYNCYEGRRWSCEGVPLHQGKAFDLTVTVEGP